MKSNFFKSFTLALLMTVSLTAFAQFEKATISGTVKDSTGALVNGATVTITSVGTNAVRTATTSGQGHYSVSDLPPSQYDVKVTSKNFADTVKRLSVAPGLQATVDFSLTLQGTQTVVEVTGTSDTQVDTETSALSQVVSSDRVANLPTLTRDPYDFVQILGNVAQDSASGTGGRNEIVRGAGVSINGARSASTDALLDGVENVNLYDTTVGQPVPQDAVQEFSVVTNNFTAAYGRASGGVINVVTKSGTNALHGDLFELNRVSRLTANDYDSNANKLAKGKYVRNQFGYGIGGPIKKDKLFFFSASEWIRVRSSSNVLVSVLDPAIVAASASATQSLFAPFTFRPGLKVLKQLNGVQSQTYTGNVNTPTFNTYATANGGNNPVFDTAAYVRPGDAGGGIPQNTYNMLHRLDFNLSDKTSMYARYVIYNQIDLTGSANTSPYAGYDTGATTKNQNILYSLTHIWNPSLVSETKISADRLNNQQPLSPKQPVQPTLFLNVNANPSILGNGVCLVGYGCQAPGGAIPFGGPQNGIELAQSFNLSKGKHNFQFGGQYLYTRDNRTFGAYENAVQGLEHNGNSSIDTGLENLLLGQAGWFQVVINPQGEFPCIKDVNGVYNVTPACTVNLPTTQPSFSRSNRYHDFAFFGQDSWKVNPRLTLNLGLRWEYYGTQHNKDPKLDSNFVFGSGSTIFDKIRNGQVYTIGKSAASPASPVGGLFRKNLHNFGPRLGFAYDLTGDGKTSLRGGYGIAYERNFGNVTFNVIQNPPAQFNSVFQGDQPIQSVNLGPFAGTGTKFLPNPSLRYVRQDLPTAYNEAWNLSLQREVLHNSLLSLEYSGSHGIHLYSIENLNQRGFGVVYEGTDPVANNGIDRLNRQYGNMNTRGANGFSGYNSLNTRFTTNNLFHQGLDLTVNYTYAHTIDNLSSTFSETPQTENLGLLDPFQPSLDRGNADYDARHRVAISAVWSLPYAKGMHGFLKQALDGWSASPIITARTGNPFTVFDSLNNIGDTVSARYQLPGGVTKVPTTGNTSTLATGAFAAPNAFNYLNLPVIDPTQVYFDPLVGSGELPTCTNVLNSAGDLVSTGQNCKWPTNMLGRNTFRGPGAYNINLAMRKAFTITERVNLQFSGEFYNLLNHSNYYVQGGSTLDVGNNGNVYPNNIFQVTGKRGVLAGLGANERRFIQFSLKLGF